MDLDLGPDTRMMLRAPIPLEVAIAQIRSFGAFIAQK
jgi:hypothetical protein